MNPTVMRFIGNVAASAVSMVIAYGVIVTVEHTVEGVRRWYHNKNNSETETSN